MDSRRDPFEELAEAFLARYRAGERPALSELIARHPEHAGQIRALLPMLVEIGQARPGPPAPGPLAEGAPGAPLGDYRIVREVGRWPRRSPPSSPPWPGWKSRARADCRPRPAPGAGRRLPRARRAGHGTEKRGAPVPKPPRRAYLFLGGPSGRHE